LFVCFFSLKEENGTNQKKRDVISCLEMGRIGLNSRSPAKQFNPKMSKGLGSLKKMEGRITE